MPPRWTLAIACAAAVLCGCVLWLANTGSSESTALATNSASPAEAAPIEEPLRLEDSRIVAPRSSLRVAARADRTIEGADTTPSPASLGFTSCVRGRVIDHDDVGVASVKVRLYRGQVERVTESDIRGRFGFEKLESGSYRLYVDGRSLPEGFLPPWRQQVPREVKGSPTGIFGTAFRLADGEEREIDLRVFAAASVRGRLVDPRGEAIETTPVTIRSNEGVTHSARTDAQGCFAMLNVYPGAYSTIVKLRAEREESAASSPLPIRFDLAAGESRVLADLVAGVGGHILRGSVVDQAGVPVAGLAVVCEEAAHAEPASRWDTVTDIAGRYEIGRVPSTELVVTVGPDECSKPEGIARISKRVVPIEVDARSAPDVLDIGFVEVEASHPFRVMGRVRVDPTWAEANRFGRWTVQVEVKEVGATRSQCVDLSRSGTRPDPHAIREFTWGCATPNGPIELTVVLLDAQGVEHERSQIVHPAADATQELLIAFP